MATRTSNLYVSVLGEKTTLQPYTVASQVKIDDEAGVESTVEAEINTLRNTKLSLGGGTTTGDIFVKTPPLDADSKLVANTEWVNDRLTMVLPEIDSMLSVSSNNLIQNKIVAREFAKCVYLDGSKPFTGDIEFANGKKISEYFLASGGTITGNTYITAIPAEGDDSTRIPTTSWVNTAISAAFSGGITAVYDSALSTSSLNAVENRIVTAAINEKAPIDSPTFTGTVIAPTPLAVSNDTNVATTAWVVDRLAVVIPDVALSATSEQPVQNKVITAALDTKAPIANPTFSGVVKAPTPTLVSNDNTVATTEWVKTQLEVDEDLSDTSTKPVQNKSIKYELDLKAPLVSPTFSGLVKAPTPPDNSFDTTVATTEWVQNRFVNVDGDAINGEFVVKSGALTVKTGTGADKFVVDPVNNKISWKGSALEISSDSTVGGAINLIKGTNASNGIHIGTTQNALQIYGTPTAGSKLILNPKKGTFTWDGASVVTIPDSDDDGSSAHNGIYRGKDLTTVYTLDELADKVFNEDWSDLFIGDYIVATTTLYGSTVQTKWRFAGFDTLYDVGDDPFNQHHIVMVPDDILSTKYMSSGTDTAGGYLASYIWTNTMTILNTELASVFGSTHVLKYRSLLSNSTDVANKVTNGYGWKDTYANLMSESQIFGVRNGASSMYDIGSNWCQFPLFRFNPRLIYGRDEYWLTSIADDTSYVTVTAGSAIDKASISENLGIRPFFLFGKV